MYNIFRLTGDGLHCLALIVLFFKMNQTGSCAGVSQFNCLFRCRLQQSFLILYRCNAGLSLKTAYLYAMVFSCRCTRLLARCAWADFNVVQCAPYS